MSLYIIAEIGVNHQGKIKLAKKLIDEAIKAGASAVKFQSFKTELLSDTKTPKVKYQKQYNPKESHYNMLKKLELSTNDQIKLFKYCKNKKIDFISTPYDLDSAKFLHNLGCSLFKVASADLVDGELHKYLNKIKAKVIISTGMSTIQEIIDTLKLYKNKKNITLLHCVSSYPTPNKLLNLNNILTLRKKFKLEIGFSDHSTNNLPALLSVAMGVNLIEKHFTLNRNMKGPDHKSSYNPNQFYKYTQDLKSVVEILGSHEKKVLNIEKEMRLVSRKSAFLKKNIAKGKILNRSYIIYKRPGKGLNYFDIKKIIGKKAIKNIRSNTIIKNDDFK